VHAAGQVIAVPMTRLTEDHGRLLKSLNAFMPDDVAIREVSIVDDGFDPRSVRDRSQDLD